MPGLLVNSIRIFGAEASPHTRRPVAKHKPRRKSMNRDSRSKKREMTKSFSKLRKTPKINRTMTKKSIWLKVIRELGVEGVRGYGYSVFCKHLGSSIDKWQRPPKN